MDRDISSPMVKRNKNSFFAYLPEIISSIYLFLYKV